MSEPKTPQRVYRLASAEEWRKAQTTGVVPLRDIDERDGYVHLSTRAQLIETANLHFAGVDDLFALEIPMTKISDQVKFELAPKRGEMFPHLYGTLHAADVQAVISLVATGGKFSIETQE